MSDSKGMNRAEVMAELARVKDELADIEETFEFTCANTNSHLDTIDQFVEDMNEHRQEVARLEALLKGLS